MEFLFPPGGRNRESGDRDFHSGQAWRAGALVLVLLFWQSVAQARVEIEHWRASTGARVYLVASTALPIVDIAVEFPAGAGHDPAGKAGLARMTLSLVKAGTARLAEAEIGRRFADVGAETRESFDRDRAGLALRTLSSEHEREQALATLADVLQGPVFPGPAFEREQARLAARMREAETLPGSLAERRFYALLYAGHPYGASPTADTVAALARDDVEDFYRKHYTSDGAVVTIVGEVTREQARVIAERLTARLPRGAPQVLPPLPAGGRGNTLRVPHPAEQSHLLLGLPGLRRDDPDYFALLAGNYILGGGGLVSRLYLEVREKRGFAYSVYSYFLPLEQPGPFIIGLQTRRDQTDEALGQVRRVFDEFVARGPKESELSAAKRALSGGFALRIDSNRKILEQVSLIGFYRLSPAWLDDFVPNVNKLTLAQVREAFARRIDPGRLVTVVVGAP